MEFQEPFTKQEIENWLKIQEDDALFCPYCYSVLRYLWTDAEHKIACINEDCRFRPIYDKLDRPIEEIE